MKKKVTLVVLNSFINDSRVLKESFTLANAGFSVAILALHEGGLAENEVLQNGINLTRIRLLSKNLPKGLFWGLLKYLEFFIRAFILLKDATIVHCNDFTALPLGFFNKIFRKTKLIYDAHEYESEVFGLSPAEKVFIRFFEKIFIRSVDAQFTVSNSIANEYMEKFGAKNLSVILNCPNFKLVSHNNYLREKFSLTSTTIIFIYQGGLGKGRGIELILGAFKRLEKFPVAVVFMGSGFYKNAIISASEDYTNIFYHPPVDQGDLLEVTASADYGLLLYENTCLNHYYCAPNKLFEYLMAGVPVIASSLFELEKLVVAESLGYVIEEHLEGVLVKKIIELSTLSPRRLMVAELGKKYSWEAQEETFLRFYNQ